MRDLHRSIFMPAQPGAAGEDGPAARSLELAQRPGALLGFFGPVALDHRALPARRAARRQRRPLPRAGHLLGIHKALRIMFPHDRDLAYRWVSTPNRRFAGARPSTS